MALSLIRGIGEQMGDWVTQVGEEVVVEDQAEWMTEVANRGKMFTSMETVVP